MGMFGRKIGKALGGIDRFAGRVANEMTTPTTGIGKLGQALRMGFDEDYQAQALAQQEAAANEQYRQAQIAALQGRIEQPQAPRLFQRRDGSIVAVDPQTLDVQPLDVPDMASNEPLVTIQTPQGPRMVPRSQGVGKVPYIKPPAGPRASTAAPKPPAGFILDN